MAVRRECSCRGVRACSLCELNRGRTAGQRLNVSKIRRAFVFCPKCHLCFEVDPKSSNKGESVIRVPGIQVVEEAISESEEASLETNVERTPWVESQSGRRKQDFGPKVNFKKQRVKTDSFRGFPSYMNTVMRSFSGLMEGSIVDFKPVELCNLKYSPDRGSCIDPHFDDFWLWGERLITLNLRGATVLTFSRAQDFSDLTQTRIFPNEWPESIEEYALTTDTICKLSQTHECRQVTEGDGTENAQNIMATQEGDVVHVALPRRSVVLVAKDARFEWHHSVLREHVTETRLAMTVRELSAAFRDPKKGREFSLGCQLLEKAKINPTL